MKNVAYKLAAATVLASSTLAAWVPAPVAAQNAGESAEALNRIERIEPIQTSSGTIVRIQLKDPAAAVPLSFSVANPARIAIDLPQTSNNLGRKSVKLQHGDLRSVNVVQAEGRSRVVLTLSRAVTHAVSVEGKIITVALGGSTEAASFSSAVAPAISSTTAASAAAGPRSLEGQRAHQTETRLAKEAMSVKQGPPLKSSGSPTTPVTSSEEDSKMSKLASLQYAAMATSMLAASTVAAQSSYETQIRASAGLGPASGTVAGLRLAHESGFQGFVAEAGLNTSAKATSFRLSWNQLADDAARTDISRLGVGYDRDEDGRDRLAFAYTTEGDTWGWTVGAMRGTGCPCFAQLGSAGAAVDRQSRSGLLGRLTYGDISSGLRLLGGLDHEWGNSSDRLTTATLMLEKYVGRSPLSFSVAWERAWLPKGLSGSTSANKVFALIRYDFTLGGSFSRRSEDDIERAALRETFHLKSFNGSYPK